MRRLGVCLLMISLTSCNPIVLKDLCYSGLESTNLNEVEKAAIKLYIRESEIDKLVKNNIIIKEECE